MDVGMDVGMNMGMNMRMNMRMNMGLFAFAKQWKSLLSSAFLHVMVGFYT